MNQNEEAYPPHVLESLREHKRHFIREFMQTMTTSALEAVEKMPEHWDGHEMRRWLADKFEEQVSDAMTPRGKRAGPRLRNYRNDIATIAGL